MPRPNPVHVLRCLRALACLLVLSSTVASGIAEKGRVPGRLLIKPAHGQAKAHFDSRLAAQAAKRVRQLEHSGIQVIEVEDSRLDQVLAALAKDPAVEFVEPDYLLQAHWLPNDPLVSSGSEWHLGKINAGPAWEITTGTNAVTVAVLDSGVSSRHPDLQNRLGPGWDFVSNDSDPQDDFGHGTAVSGVIAATGNNGIGVAGLAFNCQVMPVRVMDASGSASHSTVAQGIEYAVNHGARIINLSLGGDRTSATLQQAIDYAWNRGVLVVASAGNTGGTAPQYPAACEHVLAVGASTAQDQRARFSTYGTAVTLFAPGVGIWTTDGDSATPYSAWDGTSFSAPLVAAAAALALAADDSLTPTKLIEVLRSGADDIGDPGYDALFGYGRLNVRRTLELVRPQLARPGTEPPTIALLSPAAATTVAAGTVLTVTVTASDNVRQVEYYLDGRPWTNRVAPAFDASWQTTEAGVFSLQAVALDDNGRRGTSAPVAITVSAAAADLLPPALLLVSGPANGARLTNDIVRYTGTATDDLALDRVELSVNGHAWEPAQGSAQWTAAARLAAGVNEIWIRSVDASGNVSPATRRTVTRVVLAPVTIAIRGSGRVTPDFAGRLLEIGKAYTATAIPAPGYVFAGWGESGTEARLMRFTMESNLVLTAAFVPNPFPAVSGSYAGLAAETNGVQPRTAGAFRLQVGRLGTYSGQLRLGGERYGFSGKLSLNGTSTVSIRRPLQTPLTLQLQVNLEHPADLALGAVSDGAWSSEIISDRNIYNSQKNPAPQAGVRVFTLQGADGETAAANATGKISPSGITSVRGRLSDGRPFVSGGHVGPAGQFPFHSAFEAGQEVVLGWLDFPAGNPGETGGSVVWVRSGTNAFATQLQASAVR